MNEFNNVAYIAPWKYPPRMVENKGSTTDFVCWCRSIRQKIFGMKLFLCKRYSFFFSSCTYLGISPQVCNHHLERIWSTLEITGEFSTETNFASTNMADTKTTGLIREGLASSYQAQSSTEQTWQLIKSKWPLYCAIGFFPIFFDLRCVYWFYLGFKAVLMQPVPSEIRLRLGFH